MNAATDTALNVEQGKATFSGAFVQPTATAIADGDATPDVSGGSVFITSSNTGATAITDLDNPTAITRHDWRQVAKEANTIFILIELICFEAFPRFLMCPDANVA